MTAVREEFFAERLERGLEEPRLEPYLVQDKETAMEKLKTPPGEQVLIEERGSAVF